MKLLTLLIGLSASAEIRFGKRISTGGQHPVQFLRALHQWKRSGSTRARGCPAPDPCTCHCDCQATTFEKPPAPLLPCPTFYPPYPTNPPSAAAEIKEVVTTTTTTTSTSSEVQMQKCVLGEVQRTDGSCEKITPEIIEEMKALVRQKKRELEQAEMTYNHPLGHRLNVDIVGASGALLYSHEEYRKALDMLMAMMALYTPDGPAAVAAAAVAPIGPEFVPGNWDGNAHCEAWTVNSTCGSTPNECAVVCRHQPFCKGFAINKDLGDMCVWFDYKPQVPGTAPACAGPITSMHSYHTKARNVTVGPEVLGAMSKVRLVGDLLEGVLAKADATANIANTSLEAWESETNTSLRDSLEQLFLAAKHNYTQQIGEAMIVRTERTAAVNDALEKIQADGKLLGDPLPEVVTTTTTTTTTTTETLPPVVELHWSDFPNSEDSAWAKEHPECPMGPPCFCDCKCHGAPPQNFVEPPPPLPAPCPGPPPLPPAGSFSMPLGAPAMSPALMR